MSFSPAEPEPTAVLEIQEDEFTQALLAFWDRRNGSVSFRNSLVAALISLSLGGFALFTFYQKHQAGEIPVFFAFCSGYFLFPVIGQWNAAKKRREQAVDVWATYRNVPSPLRMYEIDGALRFTGVNYDSTFRWLDFAAVFKTSDGKIWVGQCANFALIWLPRSAFPDKSAFDDFVSRAAANFQSYRPTGSAFDVVMPVQPVRETNEPPRV